MSSSRHISAVTLTAALLVGATAAGYEAYGAHTKSVARAGWDGTPTTSTVTLAGAGWVGITVNGAGWD